jgi:hypothetical protein|tara:strand:- start:621 stop:1004 length:384 start_codon:yes stop_codon:yes gene_type:complete
MRKSLLIFLLSISTLSANDCVNYEGFVSTYKIAGAVYGSVGALKSNSCNESNFAEKKRKLFFDEILTPLMIDDVNKGKYPQKCKFVLNTMINQFHDEFKQLMEEEKELTNALNMCQDAKALLKSLED